MEFNEVLTTRRSIRSFTDQDIPADTITAILEAAMTAPSAGNQQPWRFIIIRDRQMLTAVPTVHPYAGMTAKAPVAILVCGAPTGLKWPTFWPQDCSAATQNILLAARNLDLGSVWVGIYPEEERMKGFRRLFSIPEEIVPFALIPLGWPKEGFTSVDRFNPALIREERW
ncbi:nitroreductase family protein [Desulfobulbus alkaliphilus]|uniref:nitroreductase family protein n=1 Tax=Desulfobulbus alkaliphilus TaxID=869814 RepID=UPI001965430C|nr:nitroreductase family protein [Desulfobulbus alkaliphilus]MBM9537062.1 nitroreductase family protein [Desulfobulbus alkaliphilus]